MQCNVNRIEGNTYAADAVPAAHAARPVPLAEQFHEHLAQLRESKNKPAKLREIYVLCFGDADTPEYSRLGQVATKVGGAGRLAELFWHYSAKPPTGDILAYIQKSHQSGAKGTNGHVSKTEQSMASVDAYYALVEGGAA